MKETRCVSEVDKEARTRKNHQAPRIMQKMITHRNIL